MTKVAVILVLLCGVASAFPVYDDDFVPVPIHRSYHVHKHVHMHPRVYEYHQPVYSYGGYGGYGGSYYPYYSYGAWPGYGGWANPLGTGSSWAAGGGLVGNALSFLVG